MITIITNDLGERDNNNNNIKYNRCSRYITSKRLVSDDVTMVHNIIIHLYIYYCVEYTCDTNRTRPDPTIPRPDQIREMIFYLPCGR